MTEMAFIRKWLFRGDLPRIAKGSGLKIGSIRRYLAPNSTHCSRRALSAALLVAKQNERDIRAMRRLYVEGGIRWAELEYVASIIGVEATTIYRKLRRRDSGMKPVLGLLAYFEGRKAIGIGSKDAQLLFRSGWDGEGLKVRILEKIKSLYL